MVFGAAGKSVIASKEAGGGVIEKTFTVTEGVFFDFFGYADDLVTVGSVDTNGLKGERVARLGYDTENGYFQLYIEGTQPQDFFISALPQDGNLLLASTADIYDEEFGFTRWRWLQSKPARWDGAGTSTVVIEY